MPLEILNLRDSAAQDKISSFVGPESPFLVPGITMMWLDVLKWDGIMLSSGSTSVVGFEKPTSVGRLFYSAPFGGYGGLLGDGPESESEEIFKYLKSRKYIQENIVQFTSRYDSHYPSTYTRNNLTAHVIDLSKPDLPYSENTRRNIRKSVDSGLRDTNAAQVSSATWFQLLSEHEHRSKEIRRLPRSCYDYLLRKANEVSSGVLIKCAFCYSEMVCAHIYLVSKTDAFYFDGFSSQTGLDLGANFFLLDHSIHAFRERGILRLNLGATPTRDAGLERFKEGWGAEKVKYVEYSRRSQLKRLLDFMMRVR